MHPSSSAALVVYNLGNGIHWSFSRRSAFLLFFFFFFFCCHPGSVATSSTAVAMYTAANTGNQIDSTRSDGERPTLSYCWFARNSIDVFSLSLFLALLSSCANVIHQIRVFWPLMESQTFFFGGGPCWHFNIRNSPGGTTSWIDTFPLSSECISERKV
jgi:hypothetical protein